ncbi:hypothetical protein COCSADRAFT_161027 [Bipolaris sorokiniana ND90Pr]|uniref:Uncharacterized protein n=1 Tax=Cochliobolus sativus (strain ND90Pr / ATCC 201652) TaxID=665912 RepID=M2SMW5_COCSN|nr:uncharacterized protein COCSADRAFT_161027 [Bipolaris sorokiniana ND90Pr]EMD63635.1 hypothetical protein COCSADRAFT_161027 [Bipolaris sorokiniana ND90Pr]
MASSWTAEAIIAFITLLATCISLGFMIRQMIRGKRTRTDYEFDLEGRGEIALERRNTL